MAPISWNRCYVLGGRKTSPTALTSYASYYDIISHIALYPIVNKRRKWSAVERKIREHHYEDGGISSRVPTFVQGFYAVTDYLIFFICFTHSESTFKLTTSYSIWPTKSYEVRIYCSKNFL